VELSEGADMKPPRGHLFPWRLLVSVLDSKATHSQKLTSDNYWLTKTFNHAMLIDQRTKKYGSAT
jgi:hypothetical protein